jgi:hypothetical protein
VDPRGPPPTTPGGTLVFLGTSTLASLCSPPDGSLPITDRLERDYFAMHRLEWRDAADEPGGSEFNLPLSGWFRLFAETGFDVVDFVENQAPEPTPDSVGEVRSATAGWAYRYPSEQARRRFPDTLARRAARTGRPVGECRRAAWT